MSHEVAPWNTVHTNYTCYLVIKQKMYTMYTIMYTESTQLCTQNTFYNFQLPWLSPACGLHSEYLRENLIKRRPSCSLSRLHCFAGNFVKKFLREFAAFRKPYYYCILTTSVLSITWLMTTVIRQLYTAIHKICMYVILCVLWRSFIEIVTSVI